MDIVERIEELLAEMGAGTVGAGTDSIDGLVNSVGNNTTKVAKHVKKKNVIDPKRKRKKKKIDDLIEQIILDIEIGDVVLGGRFKNKKIKVNKIGQNEKGDMTINDRPFMKIRIPEKRPVDNPDDSEVDIGGEEVST
jgi:hypothetical protein